MTQTSYSINAAKAFAGMMADTDSQARDIGVEFQALTDGSTPEQIGTLFERELLGRAEHVADDGSHGLPRTVSD